MSNHKTIVALGTILRKEMSRIFRIWPQSLIPPVVSVVLYLIIFGSVIGARIGEIGGVPYMDYIIPGLIMNIVIANSFSNTAHSFFLAKFNHSIEEMLVSPMPHWLIIMGYVGGGVIRGLLVGIFTMIAALSFTAINPVHPMFTLAVFILTSILFASLGFINGLFANSFDDTSWVASFILTPLSYLGGVFYSIESLPPLWQKVSLFNPILHIVNAFRFGMIGYSNINPYMALASLAILSVGSYCLACHMMRLGVGIKQ